MISPPATEAPVTDLLSTEEAAEVIGVSRVRVRQFVTDGRLVPANRLPHGKTARAHFFWLSDVIQVARDLGRTPRLDALPKS